MAGADAAPLLSPAGKLGWRVAQVLVWAVGMFIWGALIIKPELGLHLLWNVLIPVAPALFVFAPGIWRNVCPLGSMSLMPRHLKLSKRKIMSEALRARLIVGSLVLLFVIVPLRHVLLDTNGLALALALAVVGLLAIALGFIFEWKSGWCSSLCPVYPVEVLYGSEPAASMPNAHCGPCSRCVSPCSESTPGVTPIDASEHPLGKKAGLFLVAAFPGFVLGWYLVPTYEGWEGFRNLHTAYGIPYGLGAASLVVFLLLRQAMPNQRELLARVFAAAAISIYYWFKLPAIFGYGSNPAAAMITDVHMHFPYWVEHVLQAAGIVIFGWMLVLRNGKRRGWEIRPPFAPERASAI